MRWQNRPFFSLFHASSPAMSSSTELIKKTNALGMELTEVSSEAFARNRLQLPCMQPDVRQQIRHQQQCD